MFAKLFFLLDADKAESEQERQKALLAAGLPSPQPLGLYQLNDGTVALTRWCEGEPAGAALRHQEDQVMPALLDSVFGLYQAGWRQRDLHLDNFLFDGRQALILDAGDIDTLPEGWRRPGAILDNLALFCAQAPLDLRDTLLNRVAGALSERGLPSAGLKARVHRHSGRRIASALRKWRRASSAIASHSDEHGDWLVQRALPEEEKTALARALVAPDSLPLIKKGSRISVHGDEHWVIKHYRDTSWKARLKQRWFRGRADVSWLMGWTWALLGIPTPRPVMLLRRRDAQAVIAFPRVEGVALSHLMERDPPRAHRIAPQAECWLERLHAAGFWHGDTKAQNVLVDASEHIHWIDLDGAGFSRWQRRSRRKGQREMRRFRANWKQFAPMSPPPEPGESKSSSSSAKKA
ncbi:hypothetical protein MA04_03677 [Alcanivorax balearicus MACL04]|uniref:Aminoglycoside phosphotransferase domain-containing protein n=1 Tax=Alloalcanivorax balearicus MACL04 TaxID=1177182 RepID=A0ABT2R3U0_9GAMM|nr:hypothetical protein [Alloalcanivorax balearicus MACL04]